MNSFIPSYHFSKLPSVKKSYHSFFQPKLTVNQPDDPYEQEADAISEKVMNMETPPLTKKIAAKPFIRQKKNDQSANVFFQPNHSTAAHSNPFFSPLQIKRQISPGHSVVQLKPSYLVSHNFMGHSAEVNPEMKRRLQAVEHELQTQYDALPVAGKPATLADYAEFQSIRGWRSGSSTSRHASDSAVDVNYDNQPYIATRSQVNGTTVFGGEEGKATPATRALRQPAVEVYDRASRFTNDIPYGLIAGALAATVPGFVLNPVAIANMPNADVNERRPGETTADVYHRFKATSDALAMYLGLAFQSSYHEVLRAPVSNIEAATEAQLLAAIPLSERKDEATAILDITTFMSTPAWIASHPGFSQTPREIYFRILRDYEHVRIPMVRGNPSTSPGNTRNPAFGFLHMPQHFVVAMADIGHLRWGAADLGPGESGDVHHFDISNHGGYTPDGTP